MIKPAVGDIIFARYVLRREFARGGMSSVWEAHDKKLKRPVAIKILVPLWAETSEGRTRFEREAMAVAQLQSPHIIQIFDYGIEGESPFIVMELLDGEDLKARLKRFGRLSLDTVAAISVQAAKALSVAHAAGIIHRDLKPGNLFMVRSREEEIVKVLDFGVAKAHQVEGELEQETTKEGAILGTPQYMSPEQVLGASTVDYRTDLWSLAVIMYRALVGRVPFVGRSPADVLVKVCTEKPPRPTDIAPDLPPEIDEFFAKALEYEPAKRFQSARDLASEFVQIAPMSYPSLTMPEPLPEGGQGMSLASFPPPLLPPPQIGLAASASGQRISDALLPSSNVEGSVAPVHTSPLGIADSTFDSAVYLPRKRVTRRRLFGAGVVILAVCLTFLAVILTSPSEHDSARAAPAATVLQDDEGNRVATTITTVATTVSGRAATQASTATPAAPVRLSTGSVPPNPTNLRYTPRWPPVRPQPGPEPTLPRVASPAQPGPEPTLPRVASPAQPAQPAKPAKPVSDPFADRL